MTLKVKAVAGVKWTSISSVLVALLQLGQMAILARYLAPIDFGLMAIVMVVVGFSSLFMDMGISSAIIHRQNITHKQLSSLYWLNLGAGLLVALLIYILAPTIGLFYEEEALTPLVRLLSLTFIISAIGNQYRILYQKELQFNHLAKVEILSAFVGFIVAVYFAGNGFGVYSLVYATLAKVVVANFLFLFSGLKKHKPSLHYKHSDIKSMIGFGMFQMGERSINYFNSQFDTILIGKLLGAESLGVYTIAKTLVMKPAQIINPVITKVTFPVMAKVQDDEIKLRSIYLKTINYLCSINAPIYIAIAVLAEPVVLLLFGDKWLDAVPILQILSVYYILRSTGNPIGALQLAKGRADLGFYWNTLMFLFFPATIYFGSFFGLQGVAYSLVLLSMLFSIPNWYYMVRPLCGAKFVEYFFQILMPIILATMSTTISLSFFLILKNDMLTNFIFLASSLSFYCFFNCFFKTSIAKFAISLVK